MMNQMCEFSLVSNSVSRIQFSHCIDILEYAIYPDGSFFFSMLNTLDDSYLSTCARPHFLGFIASASYVRKTCDVLLDNLFVINGVVYLRLASF